MPLSLAVDVALLALAVMTVTVGALYDTRRPGSLVPVPVAVAVPGAGLGGLGGVQDEDDDQEEGGQGAQGGQGGAALVEDGHVVGLRVSVSSWNGCQF